MSWQDPPVNPEYFGWGDATVGEDSRLSAEAAAMESIPVVCGASEAIGASAMLPKIEAKIRSKFKFDKGFDMMVAERMAYGLSDEQTLMISQNMGNCVGNSHGCLLACRIAHEVVALGEPEDVLGKAQLSVPFIPYTYGVGRWVGGMLGPGDGSYCGAQIKGTMEYGFLPCFVDGLDEAYGDLPQGSSSVGRLFGRSKSEIQKWTDKAKSFDLIEAPKCKTESDAWELIVEKQTPLQICSGWGFRYKGFDSKYGVHLYAQGGSWSHSMQIPAAFEIKDGRFYVVRNQWGYGAAKGSPEIGIPGGCMVITADTLARWLPRSETIGLGSIKGLEVNPGA